MRGFLSNISGLALIAASNALPNTIRNLAPLPSAVNIPDSEHTLKVSIVDNGSRFNLTSTSFHVPIYEGAERILFPGYSFLLQRASGEKYMFDLGVREDWENLPPSIVEFLASKPWSQTVQINTADLLEENGIDVQGGEIQGVFWSHSHYDHIGDMTTFPSSTSLIVGKQFRESFLPAYPTNPNSGLYEHDFDNRTLEQIDFDHDTIQIGQFTAYDYFHDGSFYLMDCPGHLEAHMCGLARVTASPPSFILLGGDTTHHGGELRPSEYVPLPETIAPSPVPDFSFPTCPGHYFQDIQRDHSTTEPFYNLTADLNYNLEEAVQSVDKLKELDGDDRIWVLVAHDAYIAKEVPFFPNGTLENWKQEGWREDSRWAFLETFEEELPV